MAITMNTIPSGLRCPLFYAEIDNSQANLSGNEVLNSLLIGQKLPDGRGGHAQVLRITSVSAAKDFFGRGSQLALMAEAFLNNASMSSLYCIGLDEPEEGTTSEGLIKISGTAAESGYINLYVGAERVRCIVSRGAERAAIANDLINSINAAGDLPVKADHASSAGAEARSARMEGAILTVETALTALQAITDGSFN